MGGSRRSSENWDTGEAGQCAPAPTGPRFDEGDRRCASRLAPPTVLAIRAERRARSDSSRPSFIRGPPFPLSFVTPLENHLSLFPPFQYADVDTKYELTPDQLKEVIGNYDALIVRSATKVRACGYIGRGMGTPVGYFSSLLF